MTKEDKLNFRASTMNPYKFGPVRKHTGKCKWERKTGAIFFISEYNPIFTGRNEI